MALELGEGLAQSGQTVSYITSFWNNGEFLTRLKRLGLPACILPIGFISATLTMECLSMTMGQIRRLPNLLWGYFKILRRLRPQRIVHTNWHHLLLLLPFLRPERDLYWLHEFVPDRLQYRRVFRWFERRIGTFVCVSRAVAVSLRNLGIREAKILVIHNGVTDPAGLTNVAGLPSSRFRIGIVGQVGRWKGHDDLLEALALVRRTHTSAELHIFGKGDSRYREELERRSTDLGLSECVTWHDFVSDRRDVYANLDVCVMPSRTMEPFGLSALEAGFFCMPAIVTRRGGLPEIIEHEVNGLLVEAERPDQLAEALIRLIEEPTLRRRLGANARQRAVDHFGRERFLADFLALLNSESQTKSS